MSYVSRMYQLLPGVHQPPTNAPPGYAVLQQGYLLIVFVHDAGTFSVLLARGDDDAELAALRHEDVWDRAVQVIPGAAAWTDPSVARPLWSPRAGGGLTNAYRDQPRDLDGLLLIGDAVLTTNPSGGRGVSHSMASAAAMVEVVTTGRRESWAAALDRWDRAHLYPWFEDAVRCDADLQRRWAGRPMDPGRPLTSEQIAATAGRVPEVAAALMPYNLLAAGPDVLWRLEPLARGVYASGWEPSPPEGPTRDELVRQLATAGVPG
jgi:hypothetical protein